MTPAPSPPDFPPAMVAATEAALDSGVFYQDDFARFVLARMGGPGCTPVLLRELHLTIGDSSDPATRRAQEEAVWEELKRAPRGTYAILHYHWPDGSTFHRAPMSDGTGDFSAHAGNDPYDPDDPQAAAHVLDRMIGYEVYLCRRAVQSQREQAANLRALATHGLRPGFTHRGPIRLGSQGFSTAIITAVDPTSGQVSLHLVRRGSPKRYHATLGAAACLRVAGLDRLPTSALLHSAPTASVKKL